MNKEEILKSLKEKIQANKEEWAAMWVVVESQKLQEKPDETEIAKAELRMKDCVDRIHLLNTLLEREGGTEVTGNIYE